MMKKPKHRTYNIGESNYSTYDIQPWDIWKEYDLNGWDCDIIKRTLRTKFEKHIDLRKQRILDYRKIIHNCEERIYQLEEELHLEIQKNEELERTNQQDYPTQPYMSKKA